MRRRPDARVTAAGPHQQGVERQQRRQIHAGLGGQPHRLAGQPVEHPGRQFLPAARARATSAAHHLAGRLLDHLVDTDDAPSPGMPGIKNLPLLSPFGPVGVPSLGCTMSSGHTRACGWPRRRRSPKPVRSCAGNGLRLLSCARAHRRSPLPRSPRRCYPKLTDSPNAWPYERGRVSRVTSSRTAIRNHPRRGPIEPSCGPTGRLSA